MTKRTDSQLIVLSAAAARDDGVAVSPPRMIKAAAMKVGTSLVARKLMREARAKSGMPVWRQGEDGRAIALLITKAGLKAINAEATEGNAKPEAIVSPAPSSTGNAKDNSASQEASNREIVQPLGEAAVTVSKRRRAAAPAVRAIDARRAGSKQAMIGGMLSERAGATLDALAAWLDEQNIRPKPRRLSSGKTIQAERFRVGPLAYMLRNRFYIGEIAYKGEIHNGEHQPIVDKAIFEAVQERMQSHGVARKIRRSSSPAILTGRIYDDAGHPMSPSHANKQGVRYRYYVSQALAQGQKHRAGSVTRVSGPDVDDAVCTALRQHRPHNGNLDDRALVELQIDRIVVKAGHLNIELALPSEGATNLDVDHHQKPKTITVPFIARGTARKGYLHQPQTQPPMATETRETLLKAIGRARGWLDALLNGVERLNGDAASFDEIALREGLVERHVRFLMPLAFVAPAIIEAIADGTAPADLNVTRLAKGLPSKWFEQRAAILCA